MGEAKLTRDRSAGDGWFQSERIAPLSALALLGAFAAIVAALGGSSRPDPEQTALVRPLAALFLIPALYLVDARAWRQAPAPAALFAALALWTGLQLVPLPPAVWQGLPDRQLIAELDRLTGLEGQWRPLSLAPTRGMSALVGLIVPLAALILALACRTTSHLILHVIAAIGLISAALGFAQLAGGPGSLFYLYAYAGATMDGLSGIFANRNHGGVFCVVALLIVARLMAEGYLARQPRPAWTVVAYPLAFAVLLISVLVTGSRTAFLAAFIALAACSLQALLLVGAAPNGGPGSRRRSRRELRWFALLLAALALSLVALFVGLERAPALDRLMAQDPSADLRLQALPVVLDMVGAHWIWGSGFGSFDVLYQTYEPTELLMPNYFNQAHNDWLQIVIEGGLPACLILVGLLAWAAVAMGGIARSRGRDLASIQVVFWIAILLVIGIASATDYPLRTPIFQAMGVWLLVCLALDRRSEGLIHR